MQLLKQRNYIDLIRGSALVVSTRILTLLLGVFTTIIVARWYGVEATGLVSNNYFQDNAGGGATGGSTDEIFYENDQTVTTNYTITTNKNAMTAGPITINSGVTITIPSGSEWSIV